MLSCSIVTTPEERPLLVHLSEKRTAMIKAAKRAGERSEGSWQISEEGKSRHVTGGDSLPCSPANCPSLYVHKAFRGSEQHDPALSDLAKRRYQGYTHLRKH
ncbi:ATP-binding cassette sub-family G member 1 [Platysternon megacephalum]|uniref:ATP-binding cassette sub-family G member 1 n=1 Tax=Platysternon megacephalum TaxID=55544 RepID=A0A4D9E7X3_9SAUR|nr:ATP-binding cassette sub-family G member 1 [Platysternon megacephalum]